MLEIPPTTLVLEQIPHHVHGSSVDRIASFLGYKRCVSAHQPWGKHVPQFLTRPLWEKTGSDWYWHETLLTEGYVITLMQLTNNEIYHFNNGNNAYALSGSWKGSNKIIATYHQPEATHREITRDSAHIRSLDGVVIVGTSQRRFFEGLVGSDRVFHVPLGVDTEFFRPPPDPSVRAGRRACLFVGQWLRDIPMLARVVRLVGERRRDVSFWVVSSKENAGQLQHLRGVTYFCNVPDDELWRLYQEATVFCLPLIDCTANSALGEALACGLPIVTTDVGSVRDYVDERCGLVVPAGDAERMSDELIGLLDDRARCDAMGSASREKALGSLSWPVVAGAMKTVYETVAAG